MEKISGALSKTKTLEIPMRGGNAQFRLVELPGDRFVLEDLTIYSALEETLNKWKSENNGKLQEKTYHYWVEKQLTTQPPSFFAVIQILEEEKKPDTTPKDSDGSNKRVEGNRGNIRKALADEKMHDGMPLSALKNLGTHLFVVDSKGNLKEWSPKFQKLIYDWTHIHDSSIEQIEVCTTGQWLITRDANGFCKQHSVNERKEVKCYHDEHSGGVSQFVISMDGLYMFTSGSMKDYGIKQWRLSDQKMVKHYENAHQDHITSMICTPLGYLITGSGKHDMKQFDIKGMKEVKDYGKVFLGFIKHMTCST